MKSTELGRRENHGFQNIDSEGCQKNVIVGQTSTENLENYITELYDQANRPEDQEVEPDEEIYSDE
jgi:hypothetical protein